MTDNLTVFEKDGFAARTITEDGEIWFVAKDVAQALGYKDSTLNQLNNLFKIVPEIWAAHKPIMVRSENGVEQQREVLCLTEQGLYFFLGRSDKKAALPYQMWVAGEVVPSIRKHGFYATPQKIEDILQDPDNWIKTLEALKAERERVKVLEAKVAKDEPKVIFADAVSASEDSILVRELAKIITQGGVKMGERTLYKWLRDNHFLCSYGESWNLPRQRYVEQGLFTIKKNVIAQGDTSPIVKPTTKITGKGQQYFVDGFLSGKFKL